MYIDQMLLEAAVAVGRSAELDIDVASALQGDVDAHVPGLKAELKRARANVGAKPGGGSAKPPPPPDDGGGGGAIIGVEGRRRLTQRDAEARAAAAQRGPRRVTTRAAVVTRPRAIYDAMYARSGSRRKRKRATSVPSLSPSPSPSRCRPNELKGVWGKAERVTTDVVVARKKDGLALDRAALAGGGGGGGKPAQRGPAAERIRLEVRHGVWGGGGRSTSEFLRRSQRRTRHDLRYEEG